MVGGYSVEQINALIDYFITAKNESDQLTRQITDTITKKLGEHGITGEIANAIVEGFNKDVVPVFNSFSEISQDFINRSQTCCELTENNTKTSIARF